MMHDNLCALSGTHRFWDHLLLCLRNEAKKMDCLLSKQEITEYLYFHGRIFHCHGRLLEASRIFERGMSQLLTPHPPRIQVEMTEAPAESPTSGVIEGHDVSVVMSFQFQV